MPKFLPVALAALLLAAAHQARADDNAYPIKFHHPVKVGDKINLTLAIETAFTRRVQVDGSELKKESKNSRSTLDALMTVNAVDKQARETSFRLEIKKFQASEAAAPLADVVAPGSQIDILYENKKATFTLKDGILSAAALDALSDLFHPPHSEFTEDEMFGASDKKKIGDAWPVTPKAIAEDAQGQALELDPQKITGKTILRTAKDLAGKPALELQTNVEVTALTVPTLGQATDAKLTISLTEQIPTDLANPSANVTVKDSLHAAFEKQDNGKKVNFTIDSAGTHIENRVLVK